MSLFWPKSRLRVALFMVSLLLLNAPLASSEELTPTDAEVLTMARGQIGTRWYGIYVLGKKVGWQQDRWSETAASMCNDSQFTLKLAFLGKVSTISSREVTCYSLTPPYGTLTYESTRNEDGRVISIAGKREGDELVYTVTTESRSHTDRVPGDSDLLAHAVGWAAIARMKTGDTVLSSSLDELTGKSRWQKFTLEGTDRRTLRGKDQKVYKIRILDETGMDLDTLVNETGIVLEGAMGPSIRIVLEDKQSAMRKDLDLLDLYSTTFIDATGDVDYARVTRVRTFHATLTGESAITLAPNGRQQVTSSGDNSLTIKVDACASPPLAQSPDLSRYLECNADIPCDAPEIVTLATQALGTAAKPLERALALTRWVHKNFQYSLASGGGTGEQILAARKGDCTEYSKGLLTLLRAARIPARQLSGIVLASDTPPSFGYHAWVEVWLDGQGWVSVDPTWGSYPVDATHIVFDVDEGLQMAAHLGGLKLSIQGVTYSDDQEITCD